MGFQATRIGIQVFRPSLGRIALPLEMMNMINRSDISKDWAARGFSCDLWIDPPGQRWENFVHNTDELVLVVEGNMEFEISSHIHHPAPGQELFIPAGAVHSVRNIGSTTAHWLYGYN